MYRELVGDGSRSVVSILGSSGEQGCCCAYPFSGSTMASWLRTQALEADMVGWLQEPALFASCMTLYKLLNFTKTWFLHLINWDSNGNFPLGF